VYTARWRKIATATREGLYSLCDILEKYISLYLEAADYTDKTKAAEIKN
jgi:hypothetical protein